MIIYITDCNKYILNTFSMRLYIVSPILIGVILHLLINYINFLYLFLKNINNFKIIIYNSTLLIKLYKFT